MSSQANINPDLVDVPGGGGEQSGNAPAAADTGHPFEPRH